MKEGKIIIFSAPSGAGKTTIVHKMLANSDLNLEFSVSVCSRSKRAKELHGKDYYFVSTDTFRQMIENKEFLEWEEVYKDSYYGSKKSEVERIIANGKNVVFDIDVKGGINIKKYYGDKALSFFIMPPSIEELEKRLINRGTDSLEKIKTRIEKAKYEISFSNKFDIIIINDNLNNAIEEIEQKIKAFI